MDEGRADLAAIHSSQMQQPSVYYDNDVKIGSEIQLHARDILHHSALSTTASSTNYHPSRSFPAEAGNIDVLLRAIKQEPGQPADHTTKGGKVKKSQSTSSDDSYNISLIGTLDKPHVCNTCFKTFKNRPQLSQHELVHNNVRKHVCEFCEKSFKQLCHLNQHVRVHTGERPYKCDEEGCGRSFAQLSNLNHHKKNHEEHVKRDELRQFRCDICDRSYATNQSLHAHILKLHTTNVLSPPTSPSHSTPTVTTKKRRKVSNTDTSQYRSSKDPFPSIVDSEITVTTSNDDLDDLGSPTQVKVRPVYLCSRSQSDQDGTGRIKVEKIEEAMQSHAAALSASGAFSHHLSFPQSSYGDDRSHGNIRNFITSVTDDEPLSQNNRNFIATTTVKDSNSHQLQQSGSSNVVFPQQIFMQRDHSAADVRSDHQKRLSQNLKKLGGVTGFPESMSSREGTPARVHGSSETDYVPSKHSASPNQSQHHNQTHNQSHTHASTVSLHHQQGVPSAGTQPVPAPRNSYHQSRPREDNLTGHMAALTESITRSRENNLTGHMAALTESITRSREDNIRARHMAALTESITPSHITHHYASKTDAAANSQRSSEIIFNTALHASNVRRDAYTTNQY